MMHFPHGWTESFHHALTALLVANDEFRDIFSLILNAAPFRLNAQLRRSCIVGLEIECDADPWPL